MFVAIFTVTFVTQTRTSSSVLGYPFIGSTYPQPSPPIQPTTTQDTANNVVSPSSLPPLLHAIIPSLETHNKCDSVALHSFLLHTAHSLGTELVNVLPRAQLAHLAMFPDSLGNTLGTAHPRLPHTQHDPPSAASHSAQPTLGCLTLGMSGFLASPRHILTS